MTANDFVLDSRIFLAGIFSWAGAAKLRSDPIAEQFEILKAIGLNTTPHLKAILKFLPVFEICIGIWILDSRQFHIAMLISAALFLLFTTTLLAAIRKNYDGNCACFGSNRDSRIGLSQVVTNSMLICIALLNFYFAYGVRSAEMRSLRTVHFADLGTILFLSVLIFAVRAMVRQIENLSLTLRRE